MAGKDTSVPETVLEPRRRCDVCVANVAPGARAPVGSDRASVHVELRLRRELAEFLALVRHFLLQRADARLGGRDLVEVAVASLDRQLELVDRSLEVALAHVVLAL